MTQSTSYPKVIFKFLDNHLEKIFLVVGLLAIILFMSFQTIYRYIINGLGVTGLSIAWTEELSGFIFIWLVYLALPQVIKRRDMIRVEMVYDLLPQRIQKMTWVIVDVLFFILTATITVEGVHSLQTLLEFPQIAPTLQISYFIPYFILPLGFGLSCMRLMQDFYGQAKECGLLDTVIGCVLAGIIVAPVLLGVALPTATFLFGYFIFFFLIGVPVAISLGLAALMTAVGADAIAVNYIARLSFTSINSTTIMCIPFFIAAGTFMGVGGLSSRLFKLADQLLGNLYGGLALATIATCMIFAAMSGSGPATVAAIGSMTIPAMVERGYDKYFSAAVVACAGAIGVMIPPSNPFVVYGVSANASVGKLFLGGIVPGLLTGSVLMVISFFWSKKMQWKGDSEKRSIKSVAFSFWDAKWALLVPDIILGGIYSGIMTPTESAAIAALYGLLVGAFVYREINTKNFVSCLVDSCMTTATIVSLIAMATIFGNIMTVEQIPRLIANFILGITSNKILILLMINILLLIVGTFMEALAAIVILTPILLPIATGVGVDPVHFGVIMVINLAIGFVTPPVGVNLFVASGVARLKLQTLSKTALPFLAGMIVILLLVTYVPEICLWLPSLMK